MLAVAEVAEIPHGVPEVLVAAVREQTLHQLMVRELELLLVHPIRAVVAAVAARLVALVL
jgi:hypothetical protein